MEQILLKIPKPLKKELKHLSIEQERTMSEIVTELLASYIEMQKQKQEQK